MRTQTFWRCRSGSAAKALTHWPKKTIFNYLLRTLINYNNKWLGLVKK